MRNTIPAVILAGGLGTRMREETEYRPKPMVEIGGKPILWHVMKMYSYYGINDFIKLQEHIKKKLLIKNIFLNDVVYCPHYKTGIVKEFSINCNCRKPKTGMVKYLKENWTINIKKSLFIGDNKTDKICAQRSNINFIFYNKNLYKNIKKYIKIQKI